MDNQELYDPDYRTGESEFTEADYDVTLYDTDDIIHDLNLLLECFPPDDDLVVAYIAELKRRNVDYGQK